MSNNRNAYFIYGGRIVHPTDSGSSLPNDRQQKNTFFGDTIKINPSSLTFGIDTSPRQNDVIINGKRQYYRFPPFFQQGRL